MYTEHADFEPPKDANAKIWRYLDLPKFLSLLETSSLYFTRSDKFIDPYEGTIPKITSENISNYFTEFENSHEMKQEVFNLFSITRKMTVINCWYLSEYESDAMWQIYSNNGITIQSTYNRLKGSFEKSNERIFIGQVKYIDYESEGIYLNALAPFLFKRKSFEHEKELRAVIWNTHGEPVDDNNNFQVEFVEHGNLVNTDLDILIENIYVSPIAPKWFYELVIQILKRYNLDKRVIHSQLYSLENSDSKLDEKLTEKITISKDILDHFYKKDSYRINIETLQQERIKFQEHQNITNDLLKIEAEVSQISFVHKKNNYLGREALSRFTRIVYSKKELEGIFSNTIFQRIYLLSGKYDSILNDIWNSTLSDKEKNILLRKTVFSYTENLMPSAVAIIAQIAHNNIISHDNANHKPFILLSDFTYKLVSFTQSSRY